MTFKKFCLGFALAGSLAVAAATTAERNRP